MTSGKGPDTRESGKETNIKTTNITAVFPAARLTLCPTYMHNPSIDKVEE